ncbi:MAG TPA: 6-phosphogluconolactonase [Myxococcaceae bacterium]|nr:6-phosphogluconolactonase [Myxococcaceae bacterium]
MAGPQLRVLESLDAVARAAAQWIHDRAWAAANARGRFTLALSGGTTPRALYKQMAAGPRLPWDRTVFCFGDERPVGPDSPDSNARMARETLTGQPFVNQRNVYRIRGELPPEEAAADYEQTLRTLFPGVTTFPGFDLVLLGLGPDGHTASLFPHSPVLEERNRWVAANWVEKLRTHRITLTYPVLNAASEVLFLVAGEDKRWALREVLKGNAPVPEIPARGIRPTSGRLTFLVDRAAAAGLGESS